MTYGLTHLAIAVNDLERTLNFYQAVFDMKLMYQEKNMIQLTTPGCNDILVFQRTEEPVDGNTAGIAHFGFRLREAKDIHAMHSKLIEAGGIILETGEFVPGSPFIFFKDPSGYTVEVWYELITWF